MKITDITDDKIYTEITDFENFFDVNEDERNNYCYNLNETLYLDVDDSSYRYYTCKCDSFWSLISYQLYETTRLAWLLMKINNVKGKNMFEKKNAGDIIRYLPIETVNYILGTVNA